jgi:uncharacterized protein (TIGR04255 family)
MMKLPKYEWVQFKKSPLRLVIGQIRFTIMPLFEQRSFMASFREAIRSMYPRVSREPTVSYQLSPGGISASSGETIWRFSSRDHLWSVVLGEAAITLETRSYLSMRDFLDRFRQILEAATQTLEVTDRLRLGLRYINEIRYPGAENLSAWRSLLNPEFAGFDVAGLLDGNVDHTLQEVRIQRSNGILAIRHGFLKGSTVAPIPQEFPVSERFYLVDVDYYDTAEYDLDIPATISQMQEYNDVMSRFFRWTLSEKLYNYLEPVNAQRS